MASILKEKTKVVKRRTKIHSFQSHNGAKGVSFPPCQYFLIVTFNLKFQIDEFHNTVHDSFLR